MFQIMQPPQEDLADGYRPRRGARRLPKTISPADTESLTLSQDRPDNLLPGRTLFIPQESTARLRL